MENKSTHHELLFQLALTLLPGVGPVIAKNLISYCRSPETVFKEKKQALLAIPNVGEWVVQSIKQNKDEALRSAEKEMERMTKQNIKALFYTQADYPKRLKACNDAPILLFVKGNGNLNAAKTLAIVGTRQSTDYGKSVTEKIIHDLSGHQDLLIISGLAFGIDITAHKTCLKYHLPTVGVVAHGLDTIYPALHKSTALKMQDQGAVVSEFFCKTVADKENFPKRNRIIAGLSDAVLVVESAAKGGSLITADIANSYNRDVFALPGPVNSEFSVGCNTLIRDNKANLIQSAADINFFMGWDKQPLKNNQPKQTLLFAELNDDEKKLVDFLKTNAMADIDKICYESGIKLTLVPTLLLNLELKGILKTYPGKVYDLV
jgi:DNA processing protein